MHRFSMIIKVISQVNSNSTKTWTCHQSSILCIKVGIKLTLWTRETILFYTVPKTATNRTLYQAEVLIDGETYSWPKYGIDNAAFNGKYWFWNLISVYIDWFHKTLWRSFLRDFFNMFLRFCTILIIFDWTNGQQRCWSIWNSTSNISLFSSCENFSNCWNWWLGSSSYSLAAPFWSC